MFKENKETPSGSTKQLDNILAPINQEDFFSHWFDKKPLYISGRQEKFDRLPSIDDFLNCMQMGTPWCLQRLPEVYLDGLKVADKDIHIEYPNMDKLSIFKPLYQRYEKLMQHGATIALYGMQHIFPSLNQLTAQLSSEINAEVEAHLFLSQKDSQGLAAHYDCVDIFVLQISGSKNWKVSEQQAINPIKDAGIALDYNPEQPCLDIEMTPGDVLYMPRGTFHYAVAASQQSLHLPLPVCFATGIDFIDLLAKKAQTSELLRSYIGNLNNDSLRSNIKQLMSELNEIANSDSFIDEYIQHLATGARVHGPEPKLKDFNS